MTSFKLGLAAVAAIGGLSAPALAQNPYPYGYGQQQYPQQVAPAYGYQQGYTQNPITSVIDQLLGNRYNVTDRTAVSQCASAAMVQANAQYGGRNGYNQGYNGQGYNNQGYNGSNNGYAYNRGSTMRVTSITNVQRRSNGLRVSGLMSSGAGYNGQYGNQYGNQNGYQNQAYARGDVSFRCNVDYRGQVTDVRIGRNNRG
jgi:hypothetical protein